MLTARRYLPVSSKNSIFKNLVATIFLTKAIFRGSILGFAIVLLTACAGSAPGSRISESLPQSANTQSKNLEREHTEKSSRSEEVTAPDTTERTLPDSTERVLLQGDAAQAVEPDAFDVYVEISRIARKAISRADSFDALGMKDSVAAIAEQFSVLNPLWEEWQKHVKALDEKNRRPESLDFETLERLLIDLANANARRADFSEIKPIADSIRKFSPEDSSRILADSISRQAYSRTFGKVKKGRDAALSIAFEKAGFDDAERTLTDLLLRYPDFADTLQLRASLLKISSMRSEEASLSESFWKSHDPRLLLEEAQRLAAESKWTRAKELFQKLKSSNLRGEALRAQDSLESRFCTEKRERAASLFAKSQRKKTDRIQILKASIEELDACLDFAPNYRDRATVLSNREFLSRELAK